MLAALMFAGCAVPGPAPPAVALACDRSADLAAFEFTDPAVWKLGRDDDGAACLELLEGSSYRPPHRSPLAIAVVRAAGFADFDLRVRARQTGREYPHRDLVVVFAWRDPAHFAYAHLATAGDQNAHHVMLVDGADRRPVTTARTGGVDWGGGWHDLRVSRRGTTVEVWFDGRGPVLRGEVPAGDGRVGLGSFDDSGRFRDLEVAAR